MPDPSPSPSFANGVPSSRPGDVRQRMDEARLQRRSSLGKLFDRQPPGSPEAEMALLGSMILDPRVITDVMAVIRSGEAFYDEKHGRIYTAILQVVDAKGTLDLVLLTDKLRDDGTLELIGGPQYLEKLAYEVPTAVNAPHFASIVNEKYKLRRLIDAAGEILHEVYHAGSVTGDDARKLVDAAEQKIFEIAQSEQTSDIESISQLLHKEFERLMAIDMGKAVESGVECGFHDLDKQLTGFHPGEMVILAARPSMGKTALALNIAEQIALGTDTAASIRAVRNPVGVGVFSIEMSKASLAQRMLSGWSGISSQNIRSGQLRKTPPHDEYALLLQACQQLGRAPLYIDDTPGLTLMALRARARRMKAQHNVKVIMIDYLQLLSAPGSAKESRQAEVGAISRGIKALARELNVCIVALAQLNRNPEGRENNRPRLSDLRESGSIEQDADVVLLLHREEYYHIGDEAWFADPANEDKLGVAEVIIAKQRNGPTGTVRLHWNADATRFSNLAPEGARNDVYVPPSAAQRNANDYGIPGYGSFNDPTPDAPASLPPSAPAPFDAGTFTEPKPAPPASPAPFAAPAGPSGFFRAGRQTGPISNHRDGGGPDRDAESADPLDGASSAGPASAQPPAVPPASSADPADQWNTDEGLPDLPEDFDDFAPR
ncbi:MAG: replicative DNA helicase [Planctomycetaceae bacterium]|nr:replicative DNA helicase [Planctomycetaceae bacterium]